MNILFLGDSLIEYFDWQERFADHRVVNLGVAGESVEGLLSRVVKIKYICPEADLVFIMSGINNVAMGDLEFIDFYGIILEKLSSFYSSAAIYVHSLLPTAVPFISGDDIRSANDSLRQVAREHEAEYIDLYKIFVDPGGNVIQEYLTDDSVHLSRAGYDVWSKAVAEIINFRQG